MKLWGGQSRVQDSPTHPHGYTRSYIPIVFSLEKRFSPQCGPYVTFIFFSSIIMASAVLWSNMLPAPPAIKTERRPQPTSNACHKIRLRLIRDGRMRMTFTGYGPRRDTITEKTMEECKKHQHDEDRRSYLAFSSIPYCDLCAENIVEVYDRENNVFYQIK
jgi:hypothetical protein